MRYQIISTDNYKGFDIFKIKYMNGQIAYKCMGITFEDFEEVMQTIDDGEM